MFYLDAFIKHFEDEDLYLSLLNRVSKQFLGLTSVFIYINKCMIYIINK
jgi:hypothetical protein